jgi:hypothetical protein
MTQADICREQVVRALEKSGWIVYPDEFMLRLGRRHRLYIDIEAFRPADRSIMVVEVKCFQDKEAQTTELYTAIGQYLIYQSLLDQRRIKTPLYLAVPALAYAGIFHRMALPVIRRNHVKMILVDMGREVIEQWIE